MRTGSPSLRGRVLGASGRGTSAATTAARLRLWLRSAPAGVLVGAAAIAACTLVIYPLKRVSPVDSLGVLYLLAVLVAAVGWGAWFGVLTALASAATFDFFHIPPDGFGIAGTRNVGALVVFLVAALMAVVVAALTERVRAEAALRRREAESRARVIAAADEERRRVVRDLHDGAQQRLVHTVITLKLARRALGRGDETADALLDEALEHAQRATTELRELAHGILPAVLTRGGLRAGIEALASRMPVPVAVDVSVGRLAAPVEATAYFVVAEALTNVAKHSRAQHAAVMARVEEGELQIEVRDDGIGGTRPAGSGIVGLGDRLAALDGRLRVESPAHGGTVLAAAIPLSPIRTADPSPAPQ